MYSTDPCSILPDFITSAATRSIKNLMFERLNNTTDFITRPERKEKKSIIFDPGER
jgi:hypothetical protein